MQRVLIPSFAAVALSLAATSMQTQTLPLTVKDARHDFSPPLRTLPPKPMQAIGEHPEIQPSVSFNASTPDEVLQTSTAVGGPNARVVLNFDGIAMTGDIPPDANGAAGLTQFVEWVNFAFQVFNKNTGASLYGPASGATLFSGFGGPCESSYGGDPVVRYDQLAHRWVYSYAVFTSPYYLCVAVSQTADATGAYFRYAFPFDQPPDSQKLGIWPDGYYVTLNVPLGNPDVCALDRSAMLHGATATLECLTSGNIGFPLLPSDLDGTALPTAGAPNTLMVDSQTSTALLLWQFHADFQNPQNARLIGPIMVPTEAYSFTCGICVPQLGTSVRLIPLEGVFMYRLAYRNVKGTDTWVANHATDNGQGGIAVRWYEVHASDGGAPFIYQQGTYVPDAAYRFMGSVAMDKFGDIAVGYSVSSATLHPSIRFSGRSPSLPLNTLGPEVSILDGTGSATYYRWGDYSSMVVDPSDDCTFWYTNEYLPVDGVNWATRIASIRFPQCQKAVSKKHK